MVRAVRRTTAGSGRAEAVARTYLSNAQKRQKARSHFLSALFAPLLFLFTLQIFLTVHVPLRSHSHSRPPLSLHRRP